MIPKLGGTPLPDSPICLPREHAKALTFVLEIEAALGRAGWSSGQRRRLHELLVKWTFRAEGRDPHFEKYGSFGRRPGSAAPQSCDLIVAQWRRRIPHDAATMARRKVPYRLREAARERDRYR